MKTLIFVYNANSGTLNTLLDIGHKIISPTTYNCQLCALTHGALTEKQQWKEFRESFPHKLVFLHKDEFEEQYNQRFSYPVVLEEMLESLSVVIPTEEFKGLQILDELIDRIELIG